MNRKEFRQRTRKFMGIKGLQKKRSGGFGTQWENIYKKNLDLKNEDK